MADEHISVPRSSQLKEKATDELKRFFVIVLYLWVVFGLLSVYKSVILSQHHLDYPEHAFAIINALLFGKVLLVGEQLHLGTRFNDKPLVYPILHKCFTFTVVLFAFHLAESVARGRWHGKTMADSLPSIGGGSLKGVLSVGVICFVVLLPFFGFREIGRVVGRKELWHLIVKRKGSDPRLTV
jgi:hypothetical protein